MRLQTWLATPSATLPVSTKGSGAETKWGKAIWLLWSYRQHWMVKLFGCERVLFFKTRGKGPWRQFRDHYGCFLGFKMCVCGGGHHLNLNRPDSGLLEPCGWGHLELWGGNLPSRATGMGSPIQWVLKAGPLLQGAKGRVSDQREFFSSLKM